MSGPTQDEQISNIVWVNHLSKETCAEDLRSHFNSFGTIENVTVCLSRTFNYGFVTFASAEEADQALTQNNTELQGSQLVVDLANARLYEKCQRRLEARERLNERIEADLVQMRERGASDREIYQFGFNAGKKWTMQRYGIGRPTQHVGYHQRRHEQHEEEQVVEA